MHLPITAPTTTLAAALAAAVALWPLPARTADITIRPPQAPEPSRATTLYQHAHCGGEAGLEWVVDEERFEALRTELGQHQPDGGAPEIPNPNPESISLLLRMGVQPTPGYGVTPTITALSADGEELVISADWRGPPEGAMLPQMITTPCVLFTVDKGTFERVRLVDQDGIERGRAKPGERTPIPNPLDPPPDAPTPPPPALPGA